MPSADEIRRAVNDSALLLAIPTLLGLKVFISTLGGLNVEGFKCVTAYGD